MDKRALGYFTLSCAIASALVWLVYPEAGAWPLLIGLLPWGIHLLTGSLPFSHPSIEIPLAIFVITAGVGVWSTYDQAAALVIFWRTVASVLLYFAIAGQPTQNLKGIAWILGGFSTGLAVYFILSYDWRAHPVPVEWINTLGSAWMEIRPDLGLPWISGDVTGAILAMFLPLALVLTLVSIKTTHTAAAITAAVMSLVILLGTVMAAERGSWVGLAAALALLVVWKICCILSTRFNTPVWKIYTVGAAVTLIIGFVVTQFVFPEWLSMFGRVAGFQRFERVNNSLHLLLSYPFIGGGLASFPGLYSRYILQIPYLFTRNSHNYYLCVGIEQGWLGLLSLILVWVSALKLHGRTRLHSSVDFSYLWWGITLGSITLLLQSFTDDDFHSEFGIFVYWVLPAFIVALSKESAPAPVPETKPASRKNTAIAVSVVVVVLLALGTMMSRPLVSSWYTNLGIIELAQNQLVGWPDNRPTQEELDNSYQATEGKFSQAIRWDPENPLAHYYLGLSDMQRRDFSAAREHLVSAYTQLPRHTGIKKTLGYAYLWTNDLDHAQLFLQDISESSKELGAYTIWWADQDRPDLSNLARELNARLENR